MAKEKKVEQITDMEVDFAQWYTDVCRKAELVEYASVKGFTILRPYGYAIWENIQKILDGKFKATGHQNVYMPMLIPESLLQKEKDHVEGFAPEVAWVTMGGEEKLEERLCVRPTSETLFCEHYSHIIHSYRDLPERMAELGLVHRHELSGALHGLMRVRCFTQDDAHIFMTWDQMKDEIKGVVRLIDEVYKLFGFKYHVELSTQPEDSMGSQEDWDMATEGLRKALDSLGLPYVVNEGDGAFYGPKIDFHLEDSLGRTWQCGTIQLDFQLPMRFELEYTGADGEKHRPIMIHRVVFGSIERFIGILTEHFAGAFPIWLAPVQVELMPIADRHNEFTSKVAAELKKRGIRVEVDDRSEKIGFKIREAQLQKIPYMLVIGDKEVETENVSIRCRKRGDIGTMSVSDFCDMVEKEIREKTIITD